MSEDAPKRVGGYHSIDLTGMLIPWNARDDQPKFLSMPGSPLFYIACFTALDKLETMMADIPYEKIKQIDEGPTFLESVARPGYGVIVDPYRLPSGRVRFLQVYPVPQ